jgi:ABC-type proline/glycine betaine transport system permease subunit
MDFSSLRRELWAATLHVFAVLLAAIYVAVILLCFLGGWVVREPVETAGFPHLEYP